MKDVETFRDYIIKGCRACLYRDGTWESLDRKWKWREPIAVAKVMGNKRVVLMPDGKWVVRKKVSLNPRDYKWEILGMIVYCVLSVVEKLCFILPKGLVKLIDRHENLAYDPANFWHPRNIFHPKDHD